MPGPITYAAIALLTRDRLRRVQRSLRAKIENRPAATDLERQVAYLAEQALTVMDGSQPTVAPPARLYGPPQGDQVSQFLFLGAVGPEFTAFGAPYAPLQRWLRDTLHKGTPDEHHEQALSYSSDFVLEFWRRAGPAVTAALPTAAARDEALARLRSVVLGHCCHIATDVVSSPYVDALEARLGTPGRPKLTRAQVVSAIEAEVLGLMFAPTAPATGHEVDTWWPDPALVPAPFYTAFREALEAVYGAGARREGGAPYEALRAQHAPPLLSRELLEDGYRSFRMALGMGHSWSLPQWMGFTSFMFLPALVALPVAAALPMAKDAFRSPAPVGHDADAGLFEAINLPFALGSAIPLAYTLGLHLSPLGAEGPVIFSWVSAAAQLIAAVVFFATLGSGGVAKWLLLFALPLAIELAFIVYTLTQVNADNPRRWLLVLSGLTHLGLGAVFALLFWAFLHRAPQALNDGETGAFVGWFLLWFLILGLLWLGTTLLMRYVAAPVPARPGGTLDTGLAALPGGTTSDAVVGRSTVQLIDEAMLSFAGPEDELASPAARYFPTDRRPLLKLWWPGASPPTVLARHDRLVFTFGAVTRTVFAPAVPTRLAEFATLLQAAVTDAGGATGLQTALFFADQAAAETALLPPGLLFADHGDHRGTQAEHDTDAAAPQRLGSDEAGAYVLQAAPRRAKAVAFDRDGPVFNDLRDPTTPLAGQGVLALDPADALALVIPQGTPMRFTEAVQLGDIVEADLVAGGAARRVVVAVDSDLRLRIVTPMPGAISGNWRRIVRPTSGVEPPPAGWRVQSVISEMHHSLLQAAGAGEAFGAFFAPGDVIELQPGGANPNQRRTVVEVLSDTVLRLNRRLDAPLQAAQPGNPPPPAAPIVAFGRVASGDAGQYAYLASPDDTMFSGQALMNEAADLGVLLCLGAISHLLTDAQRDKSRFGGQTSLSRSYQIFRNWNLDRRRVNEWRMLVLGGAVDEKAGNPAAPDFAMGATPAGWASLAPDGDPTARQLGWIPLLRHWLDMAERPANDAAGAAPFRPGLPANAQLGRALAFLLDQTPPPAVPAP